MLNLKTALCVTDHLSRPDTSQSKREILHLPAADSERHDRCLNLHIGLLAGLLIYSGHTGADGNLVAAE